MLFGITDPVALGGEQANPAAEQWAEAKYQQLEVDIRFYSQKGKSRML
jgi:hypothetical protein